ncbi:MAG: hypothetical protein ACLF0G_13400 [Candidatus Brocadiia bacterium]
MNTGCSMLDAGCSMLDAGCWMLDARCWMLDARCGPLPPGLWSLASLLKQALLAPALVGFLVLVAASVCAGQREAEEPLCISGIYPSLAALSDARSECGIGAVVPWAGSLWFITYPAHYGDGKLYQVDDALRLHLRPESCGGTHAGRLVHRETNQLVIGPYVIDAEGRVRAYDVRARITAILRHLAEPARKVYVFDMEGAFFELDLASLQVDRLFKVQKRGVTGNHGKGGYTGQGHAVVANNGGGGGLAEWDGRSEKWTVVERTQFCEVTGPGGIRGAPDDRSLEHPLWATGWDRRSVILKVRDHGAWHTYRLPKGSYTHDAAHGWFTEWPRIREVGEGRTMLDFHGLYFDFPPRFRQGATGGIRPICIHLRMTPDLCTWKGRLVLASDDTSVMRNPLGGQPQSNLWFGSLDDLGSWGRPLGWGGPWVGDEVEAGVPSQPYLLAGFPRRALHISHRADAPVDFTLEIDRRGDGTWSPYQTLTVPAAGYGWHIFPPELEGEWVRITASRDCKVSAYFHYASEPHPAAGEKLFAALAPVDGEAPRTDGVLLPFDDKLWFLAQTSGSDERRLYAIDQDVAFHRRATGDDAAGKKAERKLLSVAPKAEPFAPLYEGIAIGSDRASAIVRKGGRTWRLPKADPVYDAMAGTRQLREVVTERYLMNCCGIFYEVPRGDFAGLKPIAAHGKHIADYCTWRGLLVVAGTRRDASGDGHLFRSPEGDGLWFGAIDDLWQFGHARGVGGPWRDTEVTAGQRSDPYLMAGFDRKSVELSHDADAAVTFTIEVDFLHTGTWRPYATLEVPPGETVRETFPEGYSAHWVRVVSDRPCTATAWFTYE